MIRTRDRRRSAIGQRAKEALDDRRDLRGGRGSAVWTVAASFDHLDTRGRDLATDAVELARLGAWIVDAVHHEHRYAQLPKTIFVEVLVRRRRDIEPCLTTRANDRAPVVLAVLLREPSGHALAERIGIVDHLQEEIARVRLRAIEVDRLDDDPLVAVGVTQREDRRDDRTVAVTPEHRPLDAERVEKLLRLYCAGEMELRR